MSTKYYVLYETYNEWNQFEGQWNHGYEVFSTLREAIKFKMDIENNNNYRDVSTVLAPVIN